MVDVFLYPAQANPADIVLSDPTVLRGGGVNATAVPAGVSAESGLGGATGAADALGAPAGVQASSGIGAAKSAGDANVAPSGVGAATAVGVVLAAGDAVARPAGVPAVPAIGAAVGLGDALASPAGVGSGSGVGAAVAFGDVLDGRAVPAGVGAVTGVGGATATGEQVAAPLPFYGSFAGRRRPKVKAPGPLEEPLPMRVSATACPAGVGAETGVGEAIAHGVQNPTDEELIAVLLLIA